MQVIACPVFVGLYTWVFVGLYTWVFVGLYTWVFVGLYTWVCMRRVRCVVWKRKGGGRLKYRQW